MSYFSKLMTAALVLMVLFSPLVLAKKGGGGNGGGNSGGGDFPSGFSKGEKKGWKGEATPPGWDKGKKGDKKGWKGGKTPPGVPDVKDIPTPPKP